MKKIVLMILAVVFGAAITLYAAPRERSRARESNPRVQAHIEQQKEENKTFRQSIKDLSPQEKSQSIITHRTEQHSENAAFSEEMHQEHLSKLQERLSKNTKLTDAEKAEITADWETRYQDISNHRDEQFTENMSVLEQIAADPNMTADQARTLLKNQKETQHQENQDFRQGLHEKMQTKREELKTTIQEHQNEDK